MRLSEFTSHRERRVQRLPYAYETQSNFLLAKAVTRREDVIKAERLLIRRRLAAGNGKMRNWQNGEQKIVGRAQIDTRNRLKVEQINQYVMRSELSHSAREMFCLIWFAVASDGTVTLFVWLPVCIAHFMDCIKRLPLGICRRRNFAPPPDMMCNVRQSLSVLRFT